MEESRVIRLESEQIAKIGNNKKSIGSFLAALCEELMESHEKDCIVFPSNATGLFRKIGHETAAGLNLQHLSVEKDGERHLVISKVFDPSKLFNPDSPIVQVTSVTTTQLKLRLSWTYAVRSPVLRVVLRLCKNSSRDTEETESEVRGSKHGTALTNAQGNILFGDKEITGEFELGERGSLKVTLETDSEHVRAGCVFSKLDSDTVYALQVYTEHDGAASDQVLIHAHTLHAGLGKLWCWGNNSRGVFGYVSDPPVINEPTLPQSEAANIPVSDFSAGYHHTAALSELGEIITWGCLVWTAEKKREEDKQEELRSEETESVPELVPSMPVRLTPLEAIVRFCRVSCGDTHNLAVSTDGRIWAWGLGNVGELGLGAKTFSQQPEAIKKLDEDLLQPPFFVDVACSQMVSLACTKEGAVYEWGFATHPTDPFLPVVLSSPKYVKSIIGGSVCTQLSAGSGYKAVLLRSQELYVWGQNIAGVLGIGHTHPVSCPVKVEVREVVQVSCGAVHAACVTAQGKVYIWGRGEKGQLGQGDYRSTLLPREIEGLNDVQAVSCNGNHTLILLKSGSLLACGEGKNGCLGIGVKGKAGRPMKVKTEKTALRSACGLMHSLAIFNS